MKRLVRAWYLAALLSTPVAAAEVHGQTDVFSAPGVSVAWAILRDSDEARTSVVVRLVTDAAIRTIAVKGRDPFSNVEKSLVPATSTSGCLEVRIPRASFADFPRTEWHLLGSEKEPQLVVFYLGVPDTAPEMADEKRLDTYLDQRTSRPAGAGRCPRT